MDLFTHVTSLNDACLLAGLAGTRIAVAFLLLPVFSNDTVPAMVRNALAVALGLLALALQPAGAPTAWNSWQWLTLFLREAWVGTVLGFGLGAFLWAFSMAGQVVDTHAGSTGVQLSDPQAGDQASVSAVLLNRLALFLFMCGGGFTYFVDLLLQSFRAWPIGSTALAPRIAGLGVFEAYLGDLVSRAFLLAAPVLVAMFAVDLVLGLVNRYAPQLNVSSIASSVKALAATALWMLVLAVVARSFNDAVLRHMGAILPRWLAAGAGLS